MQTKSRLLMLQGLGAILALGVSLTAQTKDIPVEPVPASDAAKKNVAPAVADDEVMVLSQFTVQETKPNDYVAAESTTGTRIASKIRDLPFQVNVVTSEFMADFGAYDMSQQLGWVSNVSPSDSQESLVLRGFTTTPFVDGFRRLGKTDIVDTARVEIIKGPAASIYGQTLPGGVVNYVGKRPSNKPQEKIDLTIGNNRFIRAGASSSGPVGNSKKLFYLANVSTQSRNFEQQFAQQKRKFGSVMFLYKLDEDTSVSVKMNAQEDHNRNRVAVPWVKSSTNAFVKSSDGLNPLRYTVVAKNPLTGAPVAAKVYNVPLAQVINKYSNNPDDLAKLNQYIANPTAYGTNGANLALSSQIATTNSWDRLGTELAEYRADGPRSYTESKMYGANIIAEHRSTNWLSHRFTFDVYQSPVEGQRISGNQVYYNDPFYPDGKIGDATPTWQISPRKGCSSQLDTLFSFNTGSIAHKLLVTLDFANQQTRSKTITIPAGTGYNDKYLAWAYPDPTNTAIRINYPFNLPLGPRSTGILRYTAPTTTTPPSYSTGAQVLDGPLTDNNYWFPTYSEYPSLYTNTSVDEWGDSDDFGLFISERATFFKGRITALIGGRYDYMKNNYKNYLGDNEASQHSKWDDQSLTYQMGVTGYATKNIVLFANASTAYNPTMQVSKVRQVSVDEDGNVIPGNSTYVTKVQPNETGKGYEYGVRFTLFQEHLNIGLSRFVIESAHKIDRFTNEYGVSESVGSGAQRSKGYELDFNWTVTESLQLLGNYGYNDARYIASTLPYLIGTNTPQNAKTNIGLALRYQFQNTTMKGLEIVAGVRHYSKSLVNVGSGGVASTNPYSASWKAIIYNTAMYNDVLPFPDLPANVAVLSANCSVATGAADPGGAIDPKTQAIATNKQTNKGFTALNIPAGWVQYNPGTAMTAGTQYYVIDGNGSTAASYTRSTSVDDNRTNVFNDPYTIYNFGVSYSLKTKVFKKMSHKIRFNVENAFDKFYTYGNGVLGFGREYKLSYSLSF